VIVPRSALPADAYATTAKGSCLSLAQAAEPTHDRPGAYRRKRLDFCDKLVVVCDFQRSMARNLQR
jgi:hypothetical protein